MKMESQRRLKNKIHFLTLIMTWHFSASFTLLSSHTGYLALGIDQVLSCLMAFVFAKASTRYSFTLAPI